MSARDEDALVAESVAALLLTDEQRGIATHVERADRDRGVKACDQK